MEDRKLIKTIERNPEKGISIALDLYGDAVKTICRQILTGAAAEDVEEAVAETFIRLWRYGKNFDASRQTTLKKYLYGIARNAALDKRKEFFANLSTECIGEREFLDEDPNVEEVLIKKEEELTVRQIVAEMEEPDRTIFSMRFFREYKVKEIAMKLELSEKQIENRLFRSKKILKEKMKEKGVRNE